MMEMWETMEVKYHLQKKQNNSGKISVNVNLLPEFIKIELV